MSVWALGDNDGQCGVSDCKKCTDLVQDADSGEAVQEWGQGVHGNSVLTAQFFSKPRDRQRERERMDAVCLLGPYSLLEERGT